MTPSRPTSGEAALAGHRGEWPHIGTDCFTMNCKGLGPEVERLCEALAATPTPTPGLDDPTTRSLLAELDACKPLMNATGPAQGGKTFSGWEVPDWLMKRVRDRLSR